MKHGRSRSARGNRLGEARRDPGRDAAARWRPAELVRLMISVTPRSNPPSVLQTLAPRASEPGDDGRSVALAHADRGQNALHRFGPDAIVEPSLADRRRDLKSDANDCFDGQLQGCCRFGLLAERLSQVFHEPTAHDPSHRRMRARHPRRERSPTAVGEALLEEGVAAEGDPFERIGKRQAVRLNQVVEGVNEFVGHRRGEPSRSLKWV